MKRLSVRWAQGVLTVFVAFVLALGAFMLAQKVGWLPTAGVKAESHDSQVIQAVERTQEISLLSLAIQGIREEHRDSQIFGQTIPGSGETVFLTYEFHAKLGVDGAEVKITRTGEGSYLISVPEFIFIGYDEPSFKVAGESGGALSWVTPDIDTTEMINEILSGGSRQAYLADNWEVLQEQTRTFYESLIAGIDPTIDVGFDFQTSP